MSNAVAIVRPPGHHAEPDSACGFCLFNTAALTARHAQKITHPEKLRILILDWDVHHGNGTQHMFEDDDRFGKGICRRHGKMMKSLTLLSLSLFL